MPDTEASSAVTLASAPGTTSVEPASIRLAAMNLLARREHTLLELRRKLGRRFTDEALVEAELQRLATEKLQSDQRFAESYLRHRSVRGYGPARLEQEMRERGLAEEDIATALENTEIDWAALAMAVFRKKFGINPVDDIKQKARCSRFMHYRGFSGDHYHHLLR